MSSSPPIEPSGTSAEVLSPYDDPGSSWGKPSADYGADAIRAYNRYLKRVLIAGEITAWLLTIATVAVFLVTMMKSNFEIIMIVDGSETSCSFDPATGEINQ